MSKRFFLTVALCSTLASTSASALTLKFDGWTNGYKGVNVTSPTYSGAAGAFNMKDTSSLNRFVVLCLDILDVIYTNQSYDYTPTPTPFIPTVDLTANGAVNRIQKIFDSGFATALTSSVNSAGFQVAVWNAIYDTDWSVANGAGTFYETSSNSGVRAQANAYLSAAENYSGPSEWNLTYLQALNTNSKLPDSQNLVTATPVPLPAGGLMLFTALGGLLVVRRRKAA